MRKKKVLITGASGLLGKAVLDLLREKKEYMVYAVTTKAEHLKDYEYASIVTCDLLNQMDCERMFAEIGPDVLIHLAWNQENAAFRQSSENLNWLNVSTRLLYLFEKYSSEDERKFMFAGSSSEYDGGEGVFSEKDDMTPSSLYGLCKKCFNEFAVQYCKKKSIDYVGMRIFTIYGEQDKHEFGAISSTIQKLMMDETVVCHSPNTTRDYIYVEDAADVIIKLMEYSFNGIVNIASGVPRTMQEVFTYIGRIMGKEDKVKMKDESFDGNRFEADVSLLRSLGMVEHAGTFEENIEKIIRYKQELCE